MDITRKIYEKHSKGCYYKLVNVQIMIFYIFQAWTFIFLGDNLRNTIPAFLRYLLCFIKCIVIMYHFDHVKSCSFRRQWKLYGDWKNDVFVFALTCLQITHWPQKRNPYIFSIPLYLSSQSLCTCNCAVGVHQSNFCTYIIFSVARYLLRQINF